MVKSNRTIIHQVATRNTFAKVWWQYAIKSVIKDNKFKREGNFKEFMVPDSRKKSQYEALETLLRKFIDEHEKHNE